MSTSTSRNSYEDCYAIFDRALESSKGIRLRHDSPEHFRVRLHYARRLDREASREAYPPDDPMHGRSVYDGLFVSVEDGFVLVRPFATPTEVEEL